MLAGHIDTVPLTAVPNLPTRRVDGELWGRGTVDMKGGVGVMLRIAAQVAEPSRDLTFLFYECEEIDGEFNGLARLADTSPELLAGDFAVLLEPTDGAIEGGCKGTLRAEVVTKGVAAHSARPWKGHNAIHDAAAVLARLTAYEAETITVDGLDYHEALQAVGISGGIAGNVIPDRCTVTVNYRYAPDKNTEEAFAHVRQVFDGFDVTLGDAADGARPGLLLPAAKAFIDALGRRRSTRRRAGPTSRASRPSASRPSTSGPATPTSRTWTTSAARSSSTSTPRPPCCAGSADLSA